MTLKAGDTERPAEDLRAELDQLRMKNEDIQRLNNDLQAANVDLYNKCTAKDKTIEDKRIENDKLQSAVRSANNMVAGVNQNLHVVERAGEQSASNLRNEREFHMKTKKELAESKKKAADLEKWCETLQQQLDEEHQKHDAVTANYNLLKADNFALNTRLDEAESQLGAYDDETYKKALEYMRIISDNLESTFLDQGKDLSPETFDDHLRRISEQARMNTRPSSAGFDHLELAAAPDERMRQTSLGDEMRNLGEQSESGDETQEKKEDDDALKVQKRRMLHSRYASIDREEIIDQRGHILSLERQKLQANNSAKEKIAKMKKMESTIQEQEAKIEQLEERMDPAPTSNQSTHTLHPPVETAAKSEQQESLIQKQQDMIETLKKQLAELKTSDRTTQATSGPGETGEQSTPSTATPAPPSGRSKHITSRYVHMERPMTPWESMALAPWQQKLLLTVLFLLCFTMAVAGWRERSFWLNANAQPISSVRYHRMNSAEMGWIYWLEQITGYQSTFLG
jgi:chromosome segregation ATPase